MPWRLQDLVHIDALKQDIQLIFILATETPSEPLLHHCVSKGVRESGWLLAHNAPQFFEYGHVYLWSLNDSHASSDAESVAGAYKVRYTVLGKYLADVIVMSDVWDVAVLPYHFDYVSKYKHMTLIYFGISWSFNIEVHRFSSVNTGSHREMLLLWSGNLYAHWLDCLHYTKETEYCD